MASGEIYEGSGELLETWFEGLNLVRSSRWWPHCI
jgi:hypothetical protein